MVVKSITAFLALLLVAIVAYGFPVLYYLYRNSMLTEAVPVSEVAWSLKMVDDEEWRPVAKYSYVVKGQRYEQTEQFQGEKFRNPYVGQDTLKTFSIQYPRVWFSPINPAEGTLEKYFPQKRAIYSAVLFGLFMYLVWGIVWYTRYMLAKHQ